MHACFLNNFYISPRVLHFIITWECPRTWSIWKFCLLLLWLIKFWIHSFNHFVFICSEAHKVTKMTTMVMKLMNFIFIFICCMHLIYITIITFSPSNQEVTMRRKNLKDFDQFPFRFCICVNELVNDSAKFQNVGYEMYTRYYYGQSRFNKSIIGWHGHMENGSTYYKNHISFWN